MRKRDLRGRSSWKPRAPKQ